MDLIVQESYNSPMAKKVLVVDDDSDIQAILRASLEKHGYEVASALDAMQGPMIAQRIKPDLVILDIMMPAGGGLSVLSRLRQNMNTMSVPILVYSAVPPEQIRETRPDTANLQVFTKPQDMTALLDEVRKKLG
jgi:DNA-binding response OmpR family regulator